MKENESINPPGLWLQVRNASWIHFVLFYAFFANLPFWIARQEFKFFHAGWFCIEYAAVGLVALFAPRTLAAVLLFLAIAADMVCGIGDTYFLSPQQCLRSIGSIHEISVARPLALTAVWLITALTVAMAAFFPVDRIRHTAWRQVAICLVGFILLCAAVDSFFVFRRHGFIPNPLKPIPERDALNPGSLEELRVCRRTVVRLVIMNVNDTLAERRHRLLQTSEFVPMAGATALAIRYAKFTGETPNLVLVLVESWGLSRNLPIQNQLTAPYRQREILSHYDVAQGSIPFYGPTVEGEGRELCGSQIGFHLLTASADELKICLPDRLANLGYHTIAVHGLDGNMFDRMDWYSRIGFHEKWFRDQFHQQGLPYCSGAFVGTCDSAIAGWIGNRLSKPEHGPDFVYWVTLNSHLPVPVPAPLPDPASCAFAKSLSTNPSLCSWFQLTANVHSSIAQLAAGALNRPTVFVIVGDHAPPFGDLEARTSFSSTVVPYTILIPRQEAQFANLGGH